MWRRFGFSLITVVGYLFISSIVIVLAQGYTVDFEARKILSTGLVEVNTFPQGATLEVDGTNTAKFTPASLTRYLPGKYLVTMNVPGYQSIDLPVDIQSELVTHLDEIAFFPKAESWRQVEVSAPVLNIVAFPELSMFLVQTETEFSWWNFNKKKLLKTLTIPTTSTAKYTCLKNGSACLVVDGNQAYFVDVLQQTKKKLKTVPLFDNAESFFRFHDDYVVLVRQGDSIIMQRIFTDGAVSRQLFVEKVDTFVVTDQNVWFVKDKAVWRQSLISGLPQQIAKTGDGQVKKLIVMSDYLLWQKTSGEVVLFDTTLESVLNTWNNAKTFSSNFESVAIVEDAKVWVLTEEKGLLFLGQTASSIKSLISYTKTVWFAQLSNGSSLLILVDPAKMIGVENIYTDLVVLPYEGILAKKADTANSLFYHTFPEQSWINRVIPTSY